VSRLGRPLWKSLTEANHIFKTKLDPKLKYPLPENVKSHTLEVTRTARWFHIGESPKNSNEIIVVLHGYGQHPSYMLNSLQSLEAPGRCICAPEGLSKFYIRGTNGRVGASWMTRDNRQQEITDQIAYLTFWLESLEIPETTPVTLIGFSQGVATAARWSAHGAKIDTLIFTSGQLPPEWAISPPNLSDRLKEIHIIRPKNDEYYTPDAFKVDVNILNQFGFHVNRHEPEGTHTLNPELLGEILN
jgi:predicted esterase